MKKFLVRSALALSSLLLAMALIVWWLWIPAAVEASYQFTNAWGEHGVEPGQFNDPTGIAVSDEEEVFVSDSRNGRIQVFNYGGQFKRIIGSAGDGPRQLGRPMNLDIFDGALYVADYWHDRIQVYGLEGTFIRSIGSSGSGPGQFNAPGGVALNARGEIYVADYYNQRVQHFSAEGEFIRQFGNTNTVGSGKGEFNYPTDVAVDSFDRVYVADGYNDRVQVFDASGEFLHKWGGPFAANIFGPFNGWFATVTSLTVDLNGNVFVADFYNNRIQKFTADSHFLTSMGSKGDGDGQFNYAMSVAVAPNGIVFATDLSNNRILTFMQSGIETATPGVDK